mmetsp:Transcript_17560/g.12525  ORF Transcript_17560/g.12525 Transcript_17560/m.12525 type:complete len:130 (+) Transcript_17560:220-609(+)
MTDAELQQEKRKLIHSIHQRRQFFDDYLKLSPLDKEIRSAMNSTDLTKQSFNKFVEVVEEQDERPQVILVNDFAEIESPFVGRKSGKRAKLSLLTQFKDVSPGKEEIMSCLSSPMESPKIKKTTCKVSH